ncbi:evolutionarily conserved signaling intermediate in Toll pathway, mitochondrial [Sitodiplosis mosellana]|uniref:evolutionarily conserved signaling intermediate in Toll pathway, mitochondrial n=1 Tax=Sitodiplosis mosellana TaxID=263140 RepID=UPI002444F00D|nr:evolutionarily conserved signaling intermediate in Toll pathway, mitochondrial [Sitodiplosis mosellana]
MFFVRRAVIDIGRKSVRFQFRSYCNAAKQFKKQNAASVANGNDNRNNNENNTENEEESSEHETNNDRQSDTDLMIRGQFDQLTSKNRESFRSMVHMFIQRDKHRRHHVEFIYAALKHMEEFGVERDLEIYKEILNVMPKGKMIPRNMFQAEFMHYPKQQDCAVFLLDQMEYNAVMPDAEMRDIIQNIFGERSHPMYKLWRQQYWMPKFKYLSPWLLPDPVPNDALELAKLAVRQMCTIDVESAVEVFDTEKVEDSLDKTWIVSGQSPEQKKLLNNHAIESPLKVEGPFDIRLRNRSIKYFTLIGEAEPDENFAPKEDSDDVQGMQLPDFLKFLSPEVKEVAVIKPKRSIHQQDDGTIYAICATGTSTKDSLLSWIRLLEANGNPKLVHIPVLFKFKAPVDDRSLIVVNNQNDNEKK